MRGLILLVLGLLAATGLFFVHGRALRRPRLLVLTGYFDVIVGAIVAVAAYSEPTFETWMQEDGWAEWATVYGFLIAAVLIGMRLLRWRRKAEVPGWLAPLGVGAVAAFCLFVAGEEISWGQRLLAFQPPEVFLEENFQQELNVHNLLTKKKIAGFSLDSRFLVAVIAIVYGGIVPLLHRTRPVERLAPLFEAVAPAAELAPWFFVVALVELSYPADLAGEACEMVLGLLFLAAAVIQRTPGDLDEASPEGLRPAAVLMSAPLALGAVTQPVVARVVYGDDEALVEQARQELELLRDDLLRPGVIRKKLRKKRRIHKRIFTAVQARYFDMSKDIEFLEGRSTAATKDAVDPRRDRRGYFLDPWNNPYWVLTTKKGRRAVLYSFGPNRRRDTKMPKKKIREDFRASGDDIVVVLSTAKPKTPKWSEPPPTP
ncbi:MAG: hypothetical protein AAF721_28860 [Myxococcota bacterium]